MWIAEEDESKTASVTRYDSYGFLLMSFGLTNAPANFCNVMNVFYYFLDKFVEYIIHNIAEGSKGINKPKRHR